MVLKRNKFFILFYTIMKKIPTMFHEKLIIIVVRALLVITIISFNSCEQKAKNATDLPVSSAIEENVSPQGILDFIEAVENSEHELHSFMIVRHGKVVAEGWWDPYKPELRHTMYSTSKSFTSTAIGFAVSEGLLTVHDKVIGFFPEQLPDTISENLADMEVRDLLSMTAGQDPEPTFFRILGSEDWIRSFLATPVVHDPGTVFLYNSAATYMLSAIIQKVTGMTLLEYLTPRLFEPLGITGMDWEVDPDGINTGGWGLRIKTEDMAKFGLLYLQKGQWKGQQILPAAWVEEATTMKIMQSPEITDEEARSKSDWLQGYCYKFWRSRHNSYRGDGAYGQLIMVLPEKDAVITVTAETPDMQGELNLVWDHLLPALMEEKPEADPETITELNDKLASLSLPPPEPGNNPDMEKSISGNSYVFEMEEGDPDTITLSFDETGCQMESISGGKTYRFSFGRGEWISGETLKTGSNLLSQPRDRIVDLGPFKVSGACSWTTDSTLTLALRYIESPHTQYYKFLFSGEDIFLGMNNSREYGREVIKVKGRGL